MSRFLRDERGATAIEYAIICSLIFLVIVSAIAPIGTALNTTFGDVAAAF